MAEAPPCDPDRYFYFEQVAKHDWLFRYVCEGLFREKPDRDDKPKWLGRLREAGVFLTDLIADSVKQPTVADLRPHVPALIERCRAWRPQRIILIKATVYDAAFEALAEAGLPVIDARIPFPASGQQQRFLQCFHAALR